MKKHKFNFVCCNRPIAVEDSPEYEMNSGNKASMPVSDIPSTSSSSLVSAGEDSLPRQRRKIIARTVNALILFEHFSNVDPFICAKLLPHRSNPMTYPGRKIFKVLPKLKLKQNIISLPTLVDCVDPI
ncbi:hypothetical protein Nepgr_026159 [Nepenthes gracilis]|uniref:Uncharacterized protein n=1 Tax=Nepenthes gracilis TaxID=150966 RepID=A0AAD3Y272_NEPGR|nr:hypothetical protein Nepgr_026159 [Nepenthes gracilis]